MRQICFYVLSHSLCMLLLLCMLKGPPYFWINIAPTADHSYLFLGPTVTESGSIHCGALRRRVTITYPTHSRWPRTKPASRRAHDSGLAPSALAPPPQASRASRRRARQSRAGVSRPTSRAAHDKPNWLLASRAVHGQIELGGSLAHRRAGVRCRPPVSLIAGLTSPCLQKLVLFSHSTPPSASPHSRCGTCSALRHCASGSRQL